MQNADRLRKNHYLSSLKVIFKFFLNLGCSKNILNAIFVIISALASLRKVVFFIKFHKPDEKFTSVTFIVKNAMFPSNLF